MATMRPRREHKVNGGSRPEELSELCVCDLGVSIIEVAVHCFYSFLLATLNHDNCMVPLVWLKHMVVQELKL